MRKILAFLVLSIFLVSLVSCSDDDNNNNNDDTPKGVSVSVVSDATTVKVGEKLDFRVVVSGAPKAKSFGVELQYDEDYFELVYGDMNMKGDLFDFSDGIGVVAFSTATDINDVVMLFTLRAKMESSAESVKCQISIKDENDASVEVLSSNINKAVIKITAKN